MNPPRCWPEALPRGLRVDQTGASSDTKAPHKIRALVPASACHIKGSDREANEPVGPGHQAFAAGASPEFGKLTGAGAFYVRYRLTAADRPQSESCRTRRKVWECKAGGRELHSTDCR